MKFSKISLLLLMALVHQLNCARILSISFVSSPSHKIIYDPLINKLASIGHEVTVISPVKSKANVPNLTNILTIDPEEYEKGKHVPNLFEMKEDKFFQWVGTAFPFVVFMDYVEQICKQSFQLPVIQQLINGELGHFDLILFSPLFNDCLYGLVHKLNTSVVLTSQITTPPWLAATFGSSQLGSFVPFPFGGFNDRMSFSERITNFLTVTVSELSRSLYYNSRMEAMYREVLGDPNLPGIKKIEANYSIILANSHVSFTPPKPQMNDIIDVGGIHLKPAKPVSKELDEFLSGNDDDGFILFSMRSALKAHTMPEKYRKLFLNTFAKLKQRVIWKWKTEVMNDLPPNVKLSKWLPQQDVLGHKNIRLFITHGCHGSTTEAVWHGV